MTLKPLATFLLSVSLFAADSPYLKDSPYLTNSRLIQLAHEGVHPEELARVITMAPNVSFDLTPTGTDALLAAGLPEQIVKDMSAREEQGPGGAPAHAGKARVFIAESPNAWSADARILGLGTRAGSHPQRVEVMKTFGQACPNYTVTNDQRQAEFTVMLERESSKVLRRDSKLAVFDHNGDMVYSGSKRALGNAVRNFCAVQISHP
jgi:hypothetical protein